MTKLILAFAGRLAATRAGLGQMMELSGADDALALLHFLSATGARRHG